MTKKSFLSYYFSSIILVMISNEQSNEQNALIYIAEIF